ncbi:MAG TPA: glycosyl hydrolase family 28-related protein, partial [Pyrinomonadaceae bacterium]
MKKISLLLFIFIFSLAVRAETLNITEFGAVPNDNIDDTPAINEAVEKLKTGGGTLVFPSGTTDISGEIPFISYGNYQS